MTQKRSLRNTGRLTVNLSSRTVEVDGRPLELTDREFGLLEMLYRRSVLDEGESLVLMGRLSVDLRTGSVRAAGRTVELSDKEFSILELLCLNRGQLVTKEMLLEHLYGQAAHPNAKTLDVFVCKLRKKLTEACGGENYIRTVWGQGLILDEEGTGALVQAEPA